jgi:hypothetical protein
MAKPLLHFDRTQFLQVYSYMAALLNDNSYFRVFSTLNSAAAAVR